MSNITINLNSWPSERCAQNTLALSIDHVLERSEQTAHQAPACTAPSARFRYFDATGAAVLDTRTGLMWTRENVGQGRLNFAAAEAACKALNLAGHRDWRLPTIKELLTLVDYTRHKPAIDTETFPRCKPNVYWSSSPAAWSPAVFAWLVDFDGGHADGYHRDDTAFVRAVRVAAAPAGQ